MLYECCGHLVLRLFGRLLTYELPLPRRKLMPYCRGGTLPAAKLASHNCSPKAVEFLQKVLRPEPGTRLLASEAFSHGWPQLYKTDNVAPIKGTPDDLKKKITATPPVDYAPLAKTLDDIQALTKRSRELKLQSTAEETRSDAGSEAYEQPPDMYVDDDDSQELISSVSTRKSIARQIKQPKPPTQRPAALGADANKTLDQDFLLLITIQSIGGLQKINHTITKPTIHAQIYVNDNFAARTRSEKFSTSPFHDRRFNITKHISTGTAFWKKPLALSVDIVEDNPKSVRQIAGMATVQLDGGFIRDAEYESQIIPCYDVVLKVLNQILDLFEDFLSYSRSPPPDKSAYIRLRIQKKIQPVTFIWICRQKTAPF